MISQASIMHSAKRVIRQKANAVLRPLGFELRRVGEYPLGLASPTVQVGNIPDRFCHNREKYQEIGAAFSNESMTAFLTGNQNNTGDLVRYYFLAMVCDLIEKEALPGDVAELGVYKGNTAFLLAQLARRLGRTAYLFDTFESLPECDFVDVDATTTIKNRKNQFVDTSLEVVQRVVGTSNVEIVPGYFPKSITRASMMTRYALVHLDCDLYAPTRAGLEFFYPKLVPNGFLIVHDYMGLYWDGVEKAVNEFFADKPERFVPIPDKSGTIAFRKHR
jgi:O-methyltransferase